MAFDLNKFLGEITAAAPIALATVLAIKDNPDATDWQKAGVALAGATQTAADLDPAEAPLLTAMNNTGQAILQEFGQILGKH